MATSVIFRLTDGKAGAALLISSALVALWFAVYGGFVFFVDATTFFGYANQLFHFRTGNYYYTLGYPLLIAITGYPVTGSVVPLLATQTAFAALTPWLAFKTFAAFERRAGIVAGIVCLVSLTPFFFQNTFFHDGTGLFFGFLSTAFASMFFGVRRPRYMYLSIASATFAYFAQPAVIGFVIAYGGAFAAFALHHSRQLKHVAVAFGIFAASIVGFSNFQKQSVHQQGSNALPSQLGRRLFFNEYLQGTPYGQFEGAAADKLRDKLIRFFGSVSSGDADKYLVPRFSQMDQYWDLFAQYQGRPVDLVDRIFAQPNRQYFELLWMVPDMPDGVADDVFLRASVAYLYHHPLVVLGYVSENLIDFVNGAPSHCVGHEVFPACRIAYGISFYPALPNQVDLARGNMPDKAYRFLTSREVSRSMLMRAADSAWQWIYYDLRLPLLVSMLFGWVASFWGPRELRWTVGSFVAAYMANLLTFSLFVEPEFRYQMVGISMCAFAAGPGIYVLLYWLARAIRAGSRAARPGSLKAS